MSVDEPGYPQKNGLNLCFGFSRKHFIKHQLIAKRIGDFHHQRTPGRIGEFGIGVFITLGRDFSMELFLSP